MSNQLYMNTYQANVVVFYFSSIRESRIVAHFAFLWVVPCATLRSAVVIGPLYIPQLCPRPGCYLAWCWWGQLAGRAGQRRLFISRWRGGLQERLCFGRSLEVLSWVSNVIPDTGCYTNLIIQKKSLNILAPKWRNPNLKSSTWEASGIVLTKCVTTAMLF